MRPSEAAHDFLDLPYIWFGGKRMIAEAIWERFGELDNYVEPFFGTGAVWIQSPRITPIETINDSDAYVANFWRAVKHDPDQVAQLMNWPVNEADLEARHKWLVTAARKRKHWERMRDDPDYFHPKIAAYWCWGLCAWIGGGWCEGEWYGRGDKRSHGQGTHADDCAKRPNLHREHGVHRQLPHLGDAGCGIHCRFTYLQNVGQGECKRRGAVLKLWMRALCDRLRNVRVCCGDWSRVCTHTPTVNLGVTGVFLDPPYAKDLSRVAAWRHSLRTGEPFIEPQRKRKSRDGQIYASDRGSDVDKVAAQVAELAITAGKDERMRIALCGYEGEHEMPADWECMHWTAHGGMGVQNQDGAAYTNKYRERVWFSPACRRVTLF